MPCRQAALSPQTVHRLSKRYDETYAPGTCLSAPRRASPAATMLTICNGSPVPGLSWEFQTAIHIELTPMLPARNMPATESTPRWLQAPGPLAAAGPRIGSAWPLDHPVARRRVGRHKGLGHALEAVAAQANSLVNHRTHRPWRQHLVPSRLRKPQDTSPPSEARTGALLSQPQSPLDRTARAFYIEYWIFRYHA